VSSSELERLHDASATNPEKVSAQVDLSTTNPIAFNLSASKVLPVEKITSAQLSGVPALESFATEMVADRRFSPPKMRTRLRPATAKIRRTASAATTTLFATGFTDIFYAGTRRRVRVERGRKTRAQRGPFWQVGTYNGRRSKGEID